MSDPVPLAVKSTSSFEHTNGVETMADLDVSILPFQDQRAGRIVLDPKEAWVEYGQAIASKLKLSPDGKKVLWPQPTDDPEDPQNWCDRRKNLQLFIISLAAIVPDFDSGIGIASIFALAKQYDTSTGTINSLTSTWSIFLIGWGGIFAVILTRRYGRLPVLFWSQLLSLGLLIGATFAPDIKTFAGMRCLTGFFATCPSVTGLFIVTDLFPFHLQARKLNIWTMAFVVAPHLSPFAFGFLDARTSFRWAYGIGCLYSLLVLVLIVFFMEETIYDRHLSPIPPRMSTGFQYRVDTLLGATAARMAKYRPSWWELTLAPFRVVWRPHLLGILVFEAMVFGFAIGINVTNAVFLGSQPPIGFGLGPFVVAGIYTTPIIAVGIGELMGRYVNDWIMNFSARRNDGIFEAESRLWSSYIAVPMYVGGFIAIGAAIQMHLSIVVIIFGWAVAEIGVMVNTVAVYAYCSDTFPQKQGEISALLNLVRVLGGFSVSFFQVNWATKHGALQTFGVESAIVAGLFVLIVPMLQWKGKYLRQRFSF